MQFVFDSLRRRRKRGGKGGGKGGKGERGGRGDTGLELGLGFYCKELGGCILFGSIETGYDGKLKLYCRYRTPFES